MAIPSAEREYLPLPDPEPPKWWELREQARERLRSAEVPNYRIDQMLGKNTEDFEKMNRLRQEARMEPVEGMLESLPYVLGSADAALGLTSIPAFTKTLGSLATPYAAMGIESALGYTDALKGIKDYPEDAPKDWRYRLMQGTLPLTALGGGMAATRFLPKIDVPSTLPNKQSKATDIGPVRDKKQFDDTVKKFEEETRIPAGYSDDLEQTNPTKYFKDQFERGEYTILNEERGELGTNPNLYNQSKKEGEPPTIQFDDGTYANANDLGYDLPKADVVDIDQTRRNILKGTGAIAGLATLPPAVKFGMKAAPTVAKTVPAAVGKGFIDLFGPNLNQFGIGNRITDSFTGGFGDMAVAPRSRKRFLTDDFEIIPVDEAIKKSASVGSHIDEVNQVIKDTNKLFGEDSITGDLQAISQSGKDHFKNYNLNPDEIQILDSESFNRPGARVASHEEWESLLKKGADPEDKLEYFQSNSIEPKWEGSEKVFAEGENLRQLPRTSSDFDYWEDLSEYIRTNGTKMGEAKPLTDAEITPGGYITDLEYYELDGIPVTLGRWTDDHYGIPVIISPNTKGMDTLMGIKPIADITKKAEGGPIDRIAEIELETFDPPTEDPGLQPVDLISLLLPQLKAAKGIPALAGFIQRGRKGGSRLGPEIKEGMSRFYRETKGGSRMNKVSPETIAWYQKYKPQLMAAAARQKQASRQGVHRIIDKMEGLE